MLNEQTRVDQITVLEDGQLLVRTARIIRDDNEEISRTWSRGVEVPRAIYVISDDRVRAVAGAVWTPTVIQDYIDSLAP